MTAPWFTRQPRKAPADEYEHPSCDMLRGKFDLEWHRADRSVGETESGYVASIMWAYLGELMLTQEQVRLALGKDGLRAWEEAVGREASEQ